MFWIQAASSTGHEFGFLHVKGNVSWYKTYDRRVHVLFLLLK